MKARNSNRTALEAALTESWRIAIGEFCHKLGIPRDQWQTVPALRGAAEVFALYRQVDELRAKHGYGIERALLDAGSELGLEPDTVSRRARGWLKASWKKDAA